MTLTELIAKLNDAHSSDVGSFEVHTDSEIGEQIGFDDYHEDDIAIGYDYMDDDLSDSDRQKLQGWLYDQADGGWRLVKTWMRVNGYTEVYDNDGSGGGLYYGVTVFRK